MIASSKLLSDKRRENYTSVEKSLNQSIIEREHTYPLVRTVPNTSKPAQSSHEGGNRPVRIDIPMMARKIMSGRSHIPTKVFCNTSLMQLNHRTHFLPTLNFASTNR